MINEIKYLFPAAQLARNAVDFVVMLSIGGMTIREINLAIADLKAKIEKLENPDNPCEEVET